MSILVLGLAGCAAPVALDAGNVASPTPGAAALASPAGSDFVGLWVREDKPDEGIGFSDTGVWTAFKMAKPVVTHPYTADGAVATVSLGRLRKHVFVLGGSEVISVQSERAVRYKRIVFFPVAGPPAVHTKEQEATAHDRERAR